jgi:hypothetical protein
MGSQNESEMHSCASGWVGSGGRLAQSPEVRANRRRKIASAESLTSPLLVL